MQLAWVQVNDLSTTPLLPKHKNNSICSNERQQTFSRASVHRRPSVRLAKSLPLVQICQIYENHPLADPDSLTTSV